MAIQNGKKPLSSKSRPAPVVQLEDIFGNTLSLDDDTKKELKEQGKAWRFISAPELQKMGGNHRYGWRPYKKPKSATMDIQFGADPDGYIRRGELILAVRDKDINDKHNAFLKQEAARAKGIAQSKAGEIRDLVGRSSGITVHEGYEDEGEEVAD